jgi:hypothetical protein
MARYLLLILFAICAALAFFTTMARPHSWYEGDCCSNNDCFKVANEDVVEIEGGWKYLPTGNEFKDPKKIRPSRDGKFHVCIMGTTSMCIYIVQGT